MMAIGKKSKETGEGKATQAPKTPASRIRQSLDDLLIPATDFVGQDSTNVLVIGIPNSKKTFSLNTVPERWCPWDGSPERPLEVLYIDADQRASVIDWKRYPHWKVISLPLGGMNPREVIDRHKDLIEGLAVSEWKPDIIIYDSISVLSRNVESYTWKDIPGEAYSKDFKGNENRFGFAEHVINMVIFGLKSKAQFFWMIAHEKEPYFKDEGAKKKFKPDIIGGIKNILPRFFHEVYFTVKHCGEWLWLTQTVPMKEPRTCYPIPRYLPMDWSIIVERRWGEFYDDGAARVMEDAQAEADEKEQQEIDKAMQKAALANGNIDAEGGEPE